MGEWMDASGLISRRAFCEGELIDVELLNGKLLLGKDPNILDWRFVLQYRISKQSKERALLSEDDKSLIYINSHGINDVTPNELVTFANNAAMYNKVGALNLLIAQRKNAVNQYPAMQEKDPGQPTIQETLNERGNRYGPFDNHAAITQAIKSVMAGTVKVGYGETIKTNWNTLLPHQKEALEMIAHKIGRILNGDPNYDDSWIDICGYSQLIVNQLQGKK